MKISFYIEDGSNPVLNVLPKSEGNIQKLREQVQNLEIENPALTFAKEYRKYEHNEPSAFSNLSDAQIEQIAKIADSEELWYKCQEKRKITGVKHEKVYSLEHQHVLSSILKCPICGAGMYGNISRKKKKKLGPNGETEWYKDQFTYVCKHRKLIDGYKCSFKRQPNQDKINAEVFAIVKEFIQKAYAESKESLDAFAVSEANEKISKVNNNSILEERKADLERLKKTYDQKEAAKNKFFDRMQALDLTKILNNKCMTVFLSIVG